MTTNDNEYPIFEVTARGDLIEFTSRFLDDESALAYLDENGRGDFARDLVRKADRLSDLQWAWVHKLASDARNKAEKRIAPRPPVAGLDLSSVVDLLDRAAEAQKRLPRIELTEPETQQRVTLTRAGDRSKAPGSVNITDGRPYGENVWFGRVNRDGSVTRGRDCTDAIIALLGALAANPAAVAAQHGCATGQCSFCSRPLSTKESRSVGYGPICAGRYGLPWGAVSAEVDAADAAAKAPLPGYDAELARQEAEQDRAFEALNGDQDSDDPFAGLDRDAAPTQRRVGFSYDLPVYTDRIRADGTHNYRS